jgi:RNA polymerase sigma-70 factor (ECF subfamily)
MRRLSSGTDEELLGSADPEAFGLFYDRHVHTMLGYFARRTRDPEAAADLTAETFAAALVARRRFRPGPVPASAWLFGIAQHKLADYHRHGSAQDRALRKLGMQRPPVNADDAELIASLGRESAADMLSELPEDQRKAVAGHVIDDVGYPELAAAAGTSEAVVRKRVSRGLSSLRARIGVRR